MNMILKVVGIIFLLLLILLFVFDIWPYYLKPDPTPPNFIGMTRDEVIEWMDKNGRIEPADYFSNTVWHKMQIGPDGNFFDTKDEIRRDSFFMSLEMWQIGHREIARGRTFSIRVYFKDDVVYEQSSGSSRDW